MNLMQAGTMGFAFLIVGWFLLMMAIFMTLGLQEYGK